MGLQTEILFVYLDCTIYFFRGATYHLGSGYVQAYLRQKGIKTSQLVTEAQVRLTDIVEQILEHQPRAVGFTCYDSNYYLSKLVAQLLKKQRPDITVLMGGPSASFSDQLIMQDTPAVDVCVRKEGEHSVAEIVERLRQGCDLTGVKGITHRRGDKIVREPDRPRGCGPNKGAELDIFPSPYLSGVFPLENIPLDIIGRIGISNSRGCPYNCIYCNFAAMSGHRIRYHSVDRVTAELSMLDSLAKKRLAPGEKLRVSLQDDAFNLNIKRAKEVCRRIMGLGLTHIKLYCETRADHVDRELLELMYAAGFRETNFGLESAVPRILRIIKKVTPQPSSDKNLTAEKRFLQQVKQAVGWCLEVGIEPRVSIISGLPTETLQEGMATLEFVKKLGVRGYIHNHLLLHAGTEVFEKQAAYGVSATPSAWCLPYITRRHYNTYLIPTLATKQLSDIGDVARKEHYFYHIQRLLVASRGNEHVFCQDILLRDVSLIDHHLLRWLNGFISPSVKLSVMNENRKLLQQEKSIENIIQAGSPLLGFTCLVPGDRWTSAVPEYVWQHGILPHKPYYQSYMHRFYFVPFSKSGSMAHNMENGEDHQRVIFFVLKDEQDRQKLIQLSERVAQKGFSVLPQEMVNLYCCFINECCWETKPCPASYLPRLIINDKNEVRTCIHGAVVGKAGDDLAYIRDNLLALAQTQVRERGCRQCSVSSQCSKCLFPSLPEQEFCRLKQESPSITNLIKMMPYARRAWLYRNLPPKIHQATFGHLGEKEKYELEFLVKLLGTGAEPLTSQTKQEVFTTMH
jgi:radical SAM superfamily enzyme YgiQ (UPF0313 family)